MNKNIIVAAITFILLAGCASVAVTEDALEKNTSHALGLEKGSFVITNREDSGMKTTYNVKTNSGKNYSCYVMGQVSIVGRIVSDAMCTEMRKSGSSDAPKKPCDALSKAAGKCK
jgi:hypothetical protein